MGARLGMAGQGDLAQVEVAGAHLAAEDAGDRLDVFPVESDLGGGDGAGFQGRDMGVIGDSGTQRDHGALTVG